MSKQPKWNIERRKAHSLRMLGNTIGSGNKGITHTQESIETTRLKNIGQKRTVEQRMNISRAHIKVLGTSNFDRRLRKAFPDGKGLGISFTEEDYNKLRIEQNGVCKICKKSETNINPKINKIRNLSTDHDHKTGLVRGLLCSHCNKRLGIYEKNGEEFKRYLLDYE